ncbi:MAG: acyl-CoA dehydrogenase family protein [Acidimicrobiia bacterium]
MAHAPDDIASWDDDAFRSELRLFLKENHPGKAPKGEAEKRAWQSDFLTLLVDCGWGAPSWPRAYGGMDLPFEKQVIYSEEYAKARLPGYPGTGVFIAAPTIIKHGTEEQRQRWLRPMVTGQLVWAQGWSEPESGSDLPSLRTTAVRDGDDYVINGQKIWSSGAQDSDRLFCLVRTGTLESYNKGISYVIVDSHAPGVDIRPIRDISGGTHFCEVFFTDVRAPITDRIGEENEGWSIARTSMGHERAAGVLNQATTYQRIVKELIELARERGLADDPLVRQKLAEAHMRVSLMYVSGARTISSIVATGDPGPASSVSRLAISTFEQWLHEVAVEIIGAQSMLAQGDPDSVQRGRWVWGFLRTRASTIGAGTAEIQRNTAAERVLGLPHEPSAR